MSATRVALLRAEDLNGSKRPRVHAGFREGKRAQLPKSSALARMSCRALIAHAGDVAAEVQRRLEAPPTRIGAA